MKTDEFEQLIQSAGLAVLSSWTSYFVVALQVPTGRGTHIESERMEYQPSEFAMLCRERAQAQIEVARKRLSEAAMAKLGVRV